MRSLDGNLDQTRTILLGLNKDDTPFVAMESMPLTRRTAGHPDPAHEEERPET